MADIYADIDAAITTMGAAKTQLQAQEKAIATQNTLIATQRTTIEDLTQQLDECKNDPGPDVWQPPVVIKEGRPFGADYVRYEDLGITGSDLRAAGISAKADKKILTLPPDSTWKLNDYTMGDVNSRFLAGLMLNPTMNGGLGIAGLAGSGASTKIGMGHSQFTSIEAANKPDQSYNYLATINWHQMPCRELGQFTLEGGDFPHWFNGIIIKDDQPGTVRAEPVIHDILFSGAAKGGWNMPPAETYAIGLNGVRNPNFDNVEFDGRSPLDHKTLWGSTFIGYNGSSQQEGKGLFRRIYAHDSISGFVGVSYASVGTFTEDVWAERMGVFSGGMNGNFWNHEISSGRIRHVRPHINLDAYWGPTDRPAKNSERPFARRRVPVSLLLANGAKQNYIDQWAHPSGGTADDVGKFGHMTFWNVNSATAYSDAEIHDPVFDSWGEKPGSFAITVDALGSGGITVFPKAFVGGVQLTPVARKQWINPDGSPAFDPTRNYWTVTDSWG